MGATLLLEQLWKSENRNETLTDALDCLGALQNPLQPGGIVGVKNKRLAAPWDDSYLEQVLFGQ